jgi:hypothetical protein
MLLGQTLKVCFHEINLLLDTKLNLIDVTNKDAYVADIFESMSEKWGHVNVGVIVCGPLTLQSSVAQEIRSHSLTRQPYHPIFHFHSHSFDL